MELKQTEKIKLNIQDSPLNKFLKILMGILILIIIGFGGFIYISSMQKNKISIDKSNNSSVISVTPAPTLEADPKDIDIGSVDGDLENIGKDVDSLQ